MSVALSSTDAVARAGGTFPAADHLVMAGEGKQAAHSVMAGEGPPSMPLSVQAPQGVDGGPSPAMTVRAAPAGTDGAEADHAPSETYHRRRGEMLQYFDRTAADTWKRLTSDAPVNRIRATVRAGRDEMRNTMLSWLPDDLRGRRVLDAGCGTGTFSVEAARRGAHVIAIDLSPTLVQHARESMPTDLGDGSIEFHVGDLLDPALGRFDHVVAMDSLIHYRSVDTVRVLAGLAARTDRSIVFTFAPRTVLLTLMWTAGRLFPRGDKSPAIEPVGQRKIARRVNKGLEGWQTARTHRINRGFYISQALEVVRP
jgi:magnesium-protoporphyrin O-methyltransferase